MTAHAEILLALLCVWAAWRERRKARTSLSRPRYPFVWIILTVVLLLLAYQERTGALNRLTNAARHASQTEGWYGQRRDVQAKFLRLVVPVAACVCLGALLLVRKSWLRYLPALGAIFYWLGFAAVQLISFHDTDWLLGQKRDGLSIRDWGNYFGLALVCFALLWAFGLDRWEAGLKDRETEQGTI